jgi:hypothetical protein
MVLKLAVQPFEKVAKGVNMKNVVFETPMFFDAEDQESLVAYKKLFIKTKMDDVQYSEDSSKFFYSFFFICTFVEF